MIFGQNTMGSESVTMALRGVKLFFSEILWYRLPKYAVWKKSKTHHNRTLVRWGTLSQKTGLIKHTSGQLRIVPPVDWSHFEYSKEGKIVQFVHFLDIVPSKTCKIDPKWPWHSWPRLTFRPFVGQRLNIFHFCKKHVKVHKICQLICSNREILFFLAGPPPLSP